MSNSAFKWISVVSLVVGCLTPHAFAQSPTTATTATTPITAITAITSGDRLHAEAVASFQQARFSEAYGRFISLANAGHAPAAELALWMYLNGPALFGKDWDTSQDQLTTWARLAKQPVPTLLARNYPKALIPQIPVATLTR